MLDIISLFYLICFQNADARWRNAELSALGLAEILEQVWKSKNSVQEPDRGYCGPTDRKIFESMLTCVDIDQLSLAMQTFCAKVISKMAKQKGSVLTFPKPGKPLQISLLPGT